MATELNAPRRATLSFMFSHPAHLLSLGFGSGLSRLMPGTFGTLFGWVVYALLAPHVPTVAWLVGVALGFVLGVYVTDYTARRLLTPDPGCVVWDEIVAIWLVLALADARGFMQQFAAFLVFRFFDMVKPPPIRYFDRHVKGGLGIMIDDIVAALMSLLLIALWRVVTR